MGHMAEAIMTKSFINPRHRKYFKEKEEVLRFFFYFALGAACLFVCLFVELFVEIKTKFV